MKFMRLHSLSPSPLLRLLLVLEWTLLGILAIAQIAVAIFTADLLTLLINGLGLSVFAVLGSIAPRDRIAKLLYTIGEFGLIFWLTFVGNIPLPALLFIVLVIRNCVLLTGKNRWIVTGLAFLCCSFSQTYRILHQSQQFKVPISQFGTILVGFILVFGLVILFLHLLVDSALQERQGQERLALANTRLRQYALQIEELATVQERNRIARDLHDSLGHSLTVFSIHLEAALRLLRSDPEQAAMLLLEVKQLNAKTLQEVRQSVTVLRSDPLQEQSLGTAIANLAIEFQRTTSILPKCIMQLEYPLNRELSVGIYRIVQESLTNICKHAGATEVEISIVQSPSNLCVTIQDNGKGFEFSQNTSGFGLQGMQERTLALGGHWEIVAAPDRGCRVSATFTNLMFP